MTPFHSRQTLESWLTEFTELGYPLNGSLKVIEQDGEAGADTGLVGITLAHANTITYVQPESLGSTRWVVTMEPRDTAVVLDPAGLLNLSAELATVSALCAFLQAKSEAFRGEDPA